MNTSKIALYTNSAETHTRTPAESVLSMLEHTDENGILYIPAWPYYDDCDEKEYFYRCVMNWDKTAADKMVSEYRALYKAMECIAPKLDAIRSDTSTVNALAADLQNVWNTYIRDDEIGDIDMDTIMDIQEKLDTIAITDTIADKLNAGIELAEHERAYYNENKDLRLSEDETALYNSYADAVHTDAVHRVGDSIAAVDVVSRARRVCRLLSLDAPAIVVAMEADLLAQAMVIHAYCKEMTVVDDVE